MGNTEAGPPAEAHAAAHLTGETPHCDAYRTLLENVPLRMFYKNADSVYLAASPSFARDVNRRPEEVIGHTDFDFFPRELAEKYRRDDRRIIASGMSDEIDEVYVCNGEERIIRTTKAPVRNGAGAVIGVVGVFTDVTDRQEFENSLQRAKEGAEAANRAKSEFLANMSHEIRTPITAILGFADLLLSPDLAPHEQHEFLDTIRKNGKALLALIGNILDLSKIEAEKMAVEHVDCSPFALIDEVLSAVRLRAVEKDLDLRVQYVFPLPETVRTDSLRLQQILVNLVGNAIKFTDQGSVSVSVGCEEPEGGKWRMRFTVCDTGIGIHPQRIGDLFQPFMQIDSSAARRYGGTGLGLAVSQRLAKILGGGIEVSSQLGKGSTFTLTIDPGPLANVRMLVAHPRLPRSEEAPADQGPEAPLCGRVLVAEDSPDIQRMIAKILTRTNLEVEIAENGRVACEKACQSLAEGRPFDAILMDIQMPEMDGFEAVSYLRSHEWRRPIIALTAHALADDRDKCINAGCDDYVSKPMTAAELRRVLGHYIGPAANQGESATATVGP